MDANDRIADVFDQLVKLGRRDALATRSKAEQYIYYIVATRCEIDIDGFNSVYEQDLTPPELKILVDGLREIKEEAVAQLFEHGYELLEADGFYNHRNWKLVSSSVKLEINKIGDEIGSDLWGLDEKLVALLDAKES